MIKSYGKLFREAVKQESPLQIIGTINAYVGLMAKKTGYKALYLSGAGVANASYGLPDLGMTTLDNVLEDARRIIEATQMPLLVDIDTGWGDGLMVKRTVQRMCRSGVAAVHIEDQVFAKRCGHRDGKMLVSTEEMCDRIKAAVDGKTDPEFVVMARTDAIGSEGFDAAIKRSVAYRDAGADMLFLEAAENIEQYREIKEVVGIPILANMTEFGKSPLLNTRELENAGVDMVLYPLSAMRAMNLAALDILKSIREQGTQSEVVSKMQTREELYQYLDYENFEALQRNTNPK
ncbi:MAG: methylisocitrate lyase [Chlamydiota bacterium]|nr:methylisocitrate lyase [Chlamydiota bacterium]